MVPGGRVAQPLMSLAPPETGCMVPQVRVRSLAITWEAGARAEVTRNSIPPLSRGASSAQVIDKERREPGASRNRPTRGILTGVRARKRCGVGCAVRMPLNGIANTRG